MFGETRIGAVVFIVRDIQRSLAFYRDSLGLDVALQPGTGGTGEGAQDWAMGQTAGGVALVFFQGEPRPGPSPVIVFALDSGGIDGVVASLAQKGVQMVTPVSHAPDGGWTADFQDPDGHILSMYQEGKLAR